MNNKLKNKTTSNKTKHFKNKTTIKNNKKQKIL